MQYCSVFNGNLFKWAYNMVNTRAIYIDPNLVYEINKKKSLEINENLSDEPSMALCPFLDMFNHHFNAKTEATLIINKENDEYFYQLYSLNEICKYNEVFISYGSHDNMKLLLEYGFFIYDNKFDCIKFNYEEIFNTLKLNFNERQFKFVREHNLLENLYINTEGPSFQLKSLLFVGFNENLKKFHTYIYGNEVETLDLKDSILKLLNFKLKVVKNDFTMSRMIENQCLLMDFLNYRVNYVENLICNLF